MSAMGSTIIDTLNFLIENPHLRNIELVDRDIPYVSRIFCARTYRASRGVSFASERDAYLDWQSYGKQQGLEYAPGRNTLLKIILKVKDEAYFIRGWIEYHARIVGYHNLIILDCGSTDPVFLRILSSYKDRVLIMNYTQYYDHIHSTWANRGLYNLLSLNCKYVTVLDADEFLFGCSGDELSPKLVEPILRNSEETILAGTWFHNVSSPGELEGEMLLEGRMTFGLTDAELGHGTVAGKAIVRSDRTLVAHHVGHNLHVKEVMALMSEHSFGQMGIFHLTHLPRSQQQQRALKHLRAKGVLPADVTNEEDVSRLVADLRDRRDQPWWVGAYLDKYLVGHAVEPRASFSTGTLSNDKIETNREFCSAFRAFGFRTLLEQHRLQADAS